MKTYTRATVIGHIGGDVILRHTKGGKPVVNLSVATNERRKDGVEQTTWHRAVLWDRLAEFASNRLNKGEPVYIEGRLSSNDWVDQQGNRRTRTEIVAHELIQLRRPQAAGDAAVVSRPRRAPMAEPAAAMAAYGMTRPARTPPVGAPGAPVTIAAGLRQPDGAEVAEVVEEIPF